MIYGSGLSYTNALGSDLSEEISDGIQLKEKNNTEYDFDWFVPSLGELYTWTDRWSEKTIYSCDEVINMNTTYVTSSWYTVQGSGSWFYYMLYFYTPPKSYSKSNPYYNDGTGGYGTVRLSASF